METLQSKLEEALGDIDALRKELQNKEALLEENDGHNHNTFACSNSEYEQLVQELEKFQKKVLISTEIKSQAIFSFFFVKGPSLWNSCFLRLQDLGQRNAHTSLEQGLKV